MQCVMYGNTDWDRKDNYFSKVHHVFKIGRDQKNICVNFSVFLAFGALVTMPPNLNFSRGGCGVFRITFRNFFALILQET